MKRNQAQKFIVLFLLFLFAYSWRVEAQTGKEKQITMEFKNEGLPSIFKRFEKVSGYKVLFIYDEISSYTSTGKVEKATVDEALKVIIGKNPLKYHIDGQSGDTHDQSGISWTGYSNRCVIFSDGRLRDGR